jgi:hypothetical protein
VFLGRGRGRILPTVQRGSRRSAKRVVTQNSAKQELTSEERVFDSLIVLVFSQREVSLVFGMWRGEGWGTGSSAVEDAKGQHRS